jgi:hypothetical protein
VQVGFLFLIQQLCVFRFGRTTTTTTTTIRSGKRKRERRGSFLSQSGMPLGSKKSECPSPVSKREGDSRAGTLPA